MKKYANTLLRRRDLLRGAAGLAAFTTLARRGDAQLAASNVSMRKTARNCIFINLQGAPSHIDTFDVKEGPWNPPDAKIQQTAGGFALSQTLFPEMSKIARDLCILRSVSSWEAAHDRGQFYLQTSHPSNPAFAAEIPNIGAVIGLERGAVGLLPPFMSLNSSNLQGAKFLGGQYEPLSPGISPNGINTLEHNFYGTNSQARFEEKFKLLRALDAPVESMFYDDGVSAQSAYFDSAKKMMYNPQIASVFRYTTDDAGRYGDTQVGRGCIIARNAVQSKTGTVFTSVVQGGWDTHQNMFDRSYAPNIYQLAGDLDRAVGALVTDLKQSGDFNSTMIVIMGEFGRTPGDLNARGGRDHHKDVMSVVMLGGGVQGGRTIGETDNNAAQIVTPGWRGDRPMKMEDITATIYSALGINWTKSITDTPSGRRFEYVPLGSSGFYVPVEEVFG
jgi:hypothetical protein